METSQTNNVIENAKVDSNKTLFSSRYQTNGITYRSNDLSVIKRDDAGNIVFLEGERNQILRIEPICTNITTTSMLKILDTQFNYFKFPTTYPIETTLDLDLDTTVELDTIDPIYARYRPNDPIRIGTAAGTWDDAAKFNSMAFDFVEDGSPQKSPGQYFITKEIKDSGANLRFRIKIEHRFDADNPPITQEFSRSEARRRGRNSITFTPPPPVGTSYFSIIKNSPDTGLNKLFKGTFANQSNVTKNWGEISQYEVKTLNLDLVIQNNEFLTGDYFTLGSFAGQNTDSAFHTINPIQSYWVITDASKNVDTWNREI